MEQQLKQRLLGTVVLVAVAVIVLPLLLDGEGYRALQDIEIDAPKRPPFDYQQEGFTVPLKDPNTQDGLLEPPKPIDIKGLNDKDGKAVSPGQDEENQQLDDSNQEVSDKQPKSQPDIKTEPTTTWVIQIASFSIRANAAIARKKIAALNTKNITTEIEKEKVNGKDVYVVKAISDDYKSLSQFAESIKKDYPDAFIKERE